MDPQALLPPGVTVFERGWLSSNNVLIRGEGGPALVDSGYWTHAAQTVALVESSIQGLPLATLVNTHLHSDHCGGNAAIQARWPNVRTLVPPGLAAAVRHWDPVALTYTPTGQACPPFRLDETLAPGTSAEIGEISWQVHAAPGHDPHSVILFEPQSRTLISADAMWENGFGMVFQELEGDDAFFEVGATLDLIESLDPVVVVPGHGRIFSDVAGALGRARSKLASYRKDPARHAAHGAKVMLKFKLLELQSVPLDAFLAWAEGTAYFGMVWRRWFASRPLQDWLQSVLQDLVLGGAAELDGTVVRNA